MMGRMSVQMTSRGVAGPVLERADVLSHVPHAFTTRLGGVSSGQFESLNFGNPSELVGEARDARSNIAANIAMVLATMQRGSSEVVQVHQVHGAGVLVVRRGQPAHGDRDDTKADAIVTDDPSRVLMVRVADCAPLLLATGDGRVVAAVHAGWKGVIAGVVPAAVKALRLLVPGGASPSCLRVFAAIGPCIRVQSFEVGEEVADAFRATFASTLTSDRIVLEAHSPRGRPHVDIVAAIRTQLAAEDVRDVEVIGGCTFAHDERYFSHRRDGVRSGRLAAMIAPARS
jgi:polyphenol oxidase